MPLEKSRLPTKGDATKNLERGEPRDGPSSMGFGLAIDIEKQIRRVRRSEAVVGRY